ncbi:transposase [Methylocystis sp. MJC1]|uniref:transposase n=1 Tax=Methylocystis sp. MJC1 TaxID=2654282 RepID=UPI0019D11BA6|nr:transposase [Methylocystis sp. MJC1]
MDEGAPQRQHSLCELVNGPRYVLRYGIAWRAMPKDLPPWSPVYQQSKRCWRRAYSRRWRRVCVPCCASPSVAPRSGWRRSSTAAPGSRPRRTTAGRLLRGKAKARLEAAYGGRHIGPFAGAACHVGQCRRPRRGRHARRRRAGGDGR